MAVASVQGFVGGTNASPTVALHPQGLTERGGGCPSLATAHTLTADSAECFKIASPAAAITQDLPTTGVKAGKRFTLIVTGATETNYVALRSSAGNEIDRVGGDGVIEVVALVDSPTTAAHWQIEHVVESVLITGITINYGSAGMTGNTGKQLKIARAGKAITLTLANEWMVTTGTTAGGDLGVTTGPVPARFRPSYQTATGLVGVENTSSITTSCGISIDVDGNIFLTKAGPTGWAVPNKRAGFPHASIAYVKA